MELRCIIMVVAVTVANLRPGGALRPRHCETLASW
jgi:hypothetical protein